jgi:hypothetical protein
VSGGSPNGGAGFLGFQEFEDTRSDVHAIRFAIQAFLAKVNTCAIVQVKAVHPDPDVPLRGGTVDVQPMVRMIDGNNNTYDHGILYTLPYHRLQGGLNAVIMSPAVDDIGFAVFCDRDITALKATRQVAPPGSRRWFDMSDGLYVPALGYFNGPPVRYVDMTDPDAMTLVDPVMVKVVTPVVEVQGDFRATGYVKAGWQTDDQVDLQLHVHKQDADSHGDTEQDTKKATPE